MSDPTETPPATIDTARLMSARDIAKFFGVSLRSVWRWREEGRLPPPIQVTRRIRRWNATDLLPLLSQRAS